MKTVKIELIAVLLALVCMTVFSVFAKSLFEESNMEKYTTVEKLRESRVRIDDWIGENYVGGWEEDGIKVTQEEIVEDYFEYLTECPYVLIVEPTGNIRCTHLAIFQEVKIIQVLKGDAKPGDMAQSIFEQARIETDENGKVSLMSMGVNLMQAGNQYLLFCDRTDMSNYSSVGYYLNSGISYFNLSDDNIASAISDGSCYADMYSSEFFGEDEAAVAAIVKFKKSLISKLREEYSF